MNEIKANLSEQKQKINDRSKELCSEIAKECSVQFVNEIDGCLDKIDNHIKGLSTAIEKATNVLSSINDIKNTIKDSVAVAKDFINHSNNAKTQIVDLSNEITKGLEKNQELFMQSAISQENIKQISESYITNISIEIEKLLEKTSVWKQQINTSAQEYSQKIDALSLNYDKANKDISFQSKTLCDTIIENQKNFDSLVGKCTIALNSVQSKYEQLLEVLKNSCNETEKNTNNYITLLKASEEKISSVFNEFQKNKETLSKTVDYFNTFTETQNYKIEALNRETKTNFIISTSLLCASIIIQIIFHFI